MRLTLSTLAVWIGLGLFATTRADDAVQLRYAYSPDEAVDYTGKSEQHSEIKGATPKRMPRSFGLTLSFAARQQATTKGAAGISLRTKLQRASLSMRINDRQAPSPDLSDLTRLEFTHQADLRGRSSEVEVKNLEKIDAKAAALASQSRSLFSDFTLPLPEEPLRVGQSWREEEIGEIDAPGLPKLPSRTVSRYTLVKIDQKHGRPYAHIAIQRNVSNAPVPGEEPTHKVTGVGKGQCLLSLDRGRLIQLEDKIETEVGPMNATPEGPATTYQITQTRSLRLQTRQGKNAGE